MLQTLTLKLDGITAGDYLAWCRDPDPPALDLGLRSISIDADPLGDTITATLDWCLPPPALQAAATAAGLPLPSGAQIDTLMSSDEPQTCRSPAFPMSRDTRPHSHAPRDRHAHQYP